jgi:hypothetical protein
VDEGSWNLLDNPVFSFMILKPVSIADEASRRQAVADAAAIANKFFSRMYNDKQNDLRGATTKTGLANWDRGSVSYQDVGPLGDNCYGRFYSFYIASPLAKDVKYNNADWLP